MGLSQPAHGLGEVHRHLAELPDASYQDRDGLVVGPTLDQVQSGHGGWAEGQAPDAVDRIGRQDHQPPGIQDG